MTRFSQSIAIKAPIERVYETITDFGRYAEFLQDVESSEILSGLEPGENVLTRLNGDITDGTTVEMRP